MMALISYAPQNPQNIQFQSTEHTEYAEFIFSGKVISKLLALQAFSAG